MTARPPINVDVTERTFYGVSLRTGLILGVTAVPVFIVAFTVGGLPLWLRGGLAVLITGLGLSLAFGQINGRTPEVWLIEWLNFRGRKRFFVHRAQKQAAESPRVRGQKQSGDAYFPPVVAVLPFTVVAA